MSRMNVGARRAERRNISADQKRPDVRPLMWQCRLAGLPVPVAEYKFHPSRKWRFDYSWPELLLAMEVEGGAFVAGRHTRGAGYVKDMEKYSEAAILGWRLLRVTPKQVQNGEALALVERAVRMVA